MEREDVVLTFSELVLDAKVVVRELEWLWLLVVVSEQDVVVVKYAELVVVVEP